MSLISINGTIDNVEASNDAEAVTAVTDAIVDLCEKRGWLFCGGTQTVTGNIFP